jgi:hypothetical protein
MILTERTLSGFISVRFTVVDKKMEEVREQEVFGLLGRTEG